jgi:hypothetical protein
MKRLIVVLPMVLLAFACGGPATDKQWYKPNVDYTAADFERDRIDCTPKKTKVLDETCMKDRGWLPLSGDVGPAVKAPQLPPRGKAGAGKY